MSTIFCYVWKRIFGHNALPVQTESACGEGHLLTKLNKEFNFPNDSR